MSGTYTENYWLAAGWPRLRSAVRRAGLAAAPTLMTEITAQRDISDHIWSTYTAQVIRELMTLRNLAMRDAAIDLVAEAELLRDEIARNITAIADDEGFKLFGLSLVRGVTRIRDKLLGGSEHRGKTWGRLDRISRELVARKEAELLTPIDRCSFVHFRSLAQHIRTAHAADKNLPRTLEAIEDYFNEFCDACAPEAMPEDQIPQATSWGSALDLPDAAAKGDMLERCLELLEGETATFVAVKYRLPSQDGLIDFSVKAFCDRTGVDRTRFGRVVNQALIELRDCLTGKIERSVTTAFAT